MRRRRNRIPNETRERIVRAFEDPSEDYLGRYSGKYNHEGRVDERPCGGRNNVKVDEEMKDCLNEIVNENCLLTLKQINEEL